MKLQFFNGLSNKYQNIKFNGNPYSGSRAVPCRRTNSHHEAESLSAILLTRLDTECDDKILAHNDFQQAIQNHKKCVPSRTEVFTDVSASAHRSKLVSFLQPTCAHEPKNLRASINKVYRSANSQPPGRLTPCCLVNAYRSSVETRNTETPVLYSASQPWRPQIISTLTVT